MTRRNTSTQLADVAIDGKTVKVFVRRALCEGVKYGVRGVSQIKFTISDSFRVFFDFDILSMIKKKTPFDFYCVILIMNLSRLISQMTFLISKICPFDFSNDTFDFQKFVAFDFSNEFFDFQNLSRLISQMTRLISKICRV